VNQESLIKFKIWKTVCFVYDRGVSFLNPQSGGSLQVNAAEG
jgi:hypothetical protein